jgi:hypothetical protein
MVPEAYVYRAAMRLIEKHGHDVLIEANRLIELALVRRETERLLVVLRIRRAIVAWEAPASGRLH